MRPALFGPINGSSKFQSKYKKSVKSAFFFHCLLSYYQLRKDYESREKRIKKKSDTINTKMGGQVSEDEK